MTTSMVTRCPKCATSFRITPAQLQSARGAVRCGSCLHIFRAQDHLVGGAQKPVAPGAPASRPAAPQPSPRPAASTTPAPKPVAAPPRKPAGAPTPQPANTARPVPAPAPKPVSAPEPKPASTSAPKPAQPVRPAATTPQPTKPAPPPAATGGEKYTSPSRYSPTATREPVLKAQPEQKEQKEQKPQQLSFDQRAIDLELENDDDDYLISDTQGLSDDEDGESDWFLAEERSENKPAAHSLFDRQQREATEDDDEDDEEAPEQDDNDEDWAVRLLDDEPEPEPATAQHTPARAPAAAPPMDEDEETQDRHPDHIKVAMHASREDEEAELFGEEFNALDGDRSHLLIGIDPAPVEMTWKPVRSWRGRRLWLGLSALALVVLATQVAWLQFDRLSLIQPYRSAYEWVCPYLGCRVPTLEDRSQIRTYNLMVRNHPEVDNALKVEAILLNNAGFEQPFPDLTLAFTDIRGELVASRRFQPSEYLRGELTGHQVIPHNQPVHISLELVDPGPAAVNYRAYIPD